MVKNEPSHRVKCENTKTDISYPVISISLNVMLQEHLLSLMPPSFYVHVQQFTNDTYTLPFYRVISPNKCKLPREFSTYELGNNFKRANYLGA